MKTQDTHADSPEGSDLKRVRELLPWHAMGTLDGADAAFMNQWLALHLQHHPELEAELDWLRSTATSLQAELTAQVKAQPPPQEDPGLTALMQRIASDQPTVGPLQAKPLTVLATPWPERLANWLDAYLGMRRPGLAFAMMALVIGQAAVIGTLWSGPAARQEALSGSPADPKTAPGSVVLSVAFNPLASEMVIRGVLAQARAQIVSGPSALGLYQIAVPHEIANESMLRLQQAVGVVESVQR